MRWHADWYEEKAYQRYSKGNLSLPQRGSQRVLRGASWGFGDPRNFWGAYRYDVNPVNRFGFSGFRLAGAW